MALHLPTGPLKTRSGLESNPLPTSLLAFDFATAPSGPVEYTEASDAFIYCGFNTVGYMASDQGCLNAWSPQA